MKTRAHIIYLLYLVADLGAILFALLLSAMYSISSYVILHSKYTIENLDIQYFFLLLAFVWYFSARSSGLYDTSRTKVHSIDAYTILKNIFFQSVCLIILLFIIKERSLTRTFILVYIFLVIPFIFLGKIGIQLLLRVFRKKFNDVSRVVIIGANELGQNVYEKLHNNSVGYNVIGYIDDNSEAVKDINILGNLSKLKIIITEESIDMVIIALSKIDIENLENIIETCRNQIVEVKIIPDLAWYYLRDFKYSFLVDIPVVSVIIDKLTEPYWRFIKRLFDICLTIFFVITIFIWFVPIIVLLQKIFNPGPIFFRSERWGEKGKPFWIYKFRTMQNFDGEKVVPTEKNDSRITKFGKILRQTSFDEFPQFYNVLRGEMSIVGPRPFDSKEAALMKGTLEQYMTRYYVKPGITGWAQINGYRGGTKDITQMQKRMDVDNWYMHNWTIGLDIQIIFYTTAKIFSGDINAY